MIENIIFKNNHLQIIDQTNLPEQLKYLNISTLDDAISALKKLQVRGAPAIGIFSAYAVLVHALNLYKSGFLKFSVLKTDTEKLIHTRPTAVNLKWAVDRMMSSISAETSASDIIKIFMALAREIHSEDRIACDRIGDIGIGLIKDNFNILTHCNAGILATGGIGTALAPIYKAAQSGLKIHVYVSETRPLGQGARLTFWELQKAKIPATLITDSMVGALMAEKKVDLVIVGADRICMNGDFANKIGTYSLAVLTNFHKIPFYAAAPVSTFDQGCNTGKEMTIENRSADEIFKFWGYHVVPQQSFNPAFDVTPGGLLSGIITNVNLIQQPLIDTINETLRSNKP